MASRMPWLTRRRFLMGGVLCAALPRAAIANGDAFYEAQEIPGQAEYVYFGSVKDQRGNYIEGAMVVAEVSEPHLTYDVYTNVLGRYRSPDVGRAVADLGFKVDPAKITMMAYKPGYTMLRRLNRGSPRAKKGAFELNFVMVEDSDPAKSLGGN